MRSLHNGGSIWVFRVSDTKSCRAIQNAVPAQLWTSSGVENTKWIEPCHAIQNDVSAQRLTCLCAERLGH